MPESDAAARSWTFELPIRRPLSLNGQHRNPFAAARDRRVIRSAVRVLAYKEKIPPLRRARIELHYVPRDRRRHDPINLTPTLKPVEDGLVDAGVIPDDTPEFIDPCMPIIHPPAGGHGRYFVVVHDLDTTTTEEAPTP